MAPSSGGEILHSDRAKRVAQLQQQICNERVRRLLLLLLLAALTLYCSVSLVLVLSTIYGVLSEDNKARLPEGLIDSSSIQKWYRKFGTLDTAPPNGNVFGPRTQTEVVCHKHKQFSNQDYLYSCYIGFMSKYMKCGRLDYNCRWFSYRHHRRHHPSMTSLHDVTQPIKLIYSIGLQRPEINAIPTDHY